MKKKPYLLLTTLSLLAIMFCSIMSNNNPVSAVTISGEKGIVEGVSALQFNGNYGNGHALFNVNLVCADNVSCTTLNPTAWSCWLPTAGNTLDETKIGEIHVENCSTSNNTKTCDVWLIPNIDYTTLLPQYQPADPSKVEKGYAGARAYGQDVDTCNTKRVGDSQMCWGQQSVKGQVSAPVLPTPPTTWTEETKESYSEDHYLTIKYKEEGTEKELKDSTKMGPYTLTGNKIITKECTKENNKTTCIIIDETKNPTHIEDAYATYTPITGYDYVRADPNTGPFKMNQDHTVTFYYKRQPVITTQTRTTEDKKTYTLTVNYLDNTTKTAIGSCAPSKTDVYTITTTYTYKDTYQDGKLINTELINTSSTPPETATVSHPNTICNGEYRYVSSDPNVSSFTMNNNYTVNLYYTKKHTLTVTHKRLVGYTNICTEPNKVASYYENDNVNNISVTVNGRISCNAGTYDFYTIDSDNNTTHTNRTVNPKSTTKDSSARAVYRRINTLTLNHRDFYNKPGPDIAGDQKNTAYDKETATINPVSDDFTYNNYKYKLYGYANSRDDVITPSKNTIYRESNMTGDVERYAFYKKVLNLTIIPVNNSCTPIADSIIKTTLEGNSISAKTTTYINNYTFTGFTEKCDNTPTNLDFPNSYIYSVSEIHKHVKVYAVYETSDSLHTACPPTNGNFVQSYVRNNRLVKEEDKDKWTLTKTYAKLGDTISYCTGYDNKYPYWNFMYPDYDYLISCNRFPNPGQAIPLGYRGALDNQLQSNFLVDSNRNILRYSDNYQLKATQNRTTQQNNFNSTKRSVIKDYPTNINDNKNDVGEKDGIYEIGYINYNSFDTSISLVSSSRESCGQLVTSLPRGNKTLEYNKATAIFPYNFANNTEIKYTGGDYLYAGDTTEATITLKVNPKENSATRTDIGGPYATVDEGDIYYRIRVYTENGDPKIDTITNALPYRNKINSDNNVNGASVKKQETLYIPDADPGTKLCIQSSIWPVNSDKDGTGTSIDPNGGWTESDRNRGDGWSAWSEADCRIIASKPSLQVWGGNIITNGKISTDYATKYHLNGINTYYPINDNNYRNKYAFGSWGELGIIANQSTEFTASGSALSYPNGMQNPIGIQDKQLFSKFVPLTFANYDPNNKTNSVLFGNLNKTYTSSEQTFDKSTLVEKYIYNTPANITGNTLALNQSTTAVHINDPNIFHGDNNTYYYHSDSDLTINESELARNATYVIHVKDKKIQIAGNLKYQDVYTTLENIPKLIIYAENGTISIDKNVDRVDAILIANTVITCSEESGCTIPTDDTNSTVITNQANHSKQLTINGAIIANKVIPNRTYGAGKGAGRTYDDPQVNSVTPAEIINFDASLYRWEQYSRKNADGVKTDAALITTYIKEVAPRY